MTPAHWKSQQTERHTSSDQHDEQQLLCLWKGQISYFSPWQPAGSSCLRLKKPYLQRSQRRPSTFSLQTHWPVRASHRPPPCEPAGSQSHAETQEEVSWWVCLTSLWLQTKPKDRPDGDKVMPVTRTVKQLWLVFLSWSPQGWWRPSFWLRSIITIITYDLYLSGLAECGGR